MGFRFDMVRLAICLLLMLLPARLGAEPVAPEAPTVSLVTFGPGEEFYEKFAHNAIWIHDPSAKPEYQDLCYNFGLFDFSGDFIFRFALGTPRYSMAPFDTSESFEEYRQNNRDIYVQALRFSPEQARQLADALWTNAQPQNREYPYNPYTDNCSTRVRDALDKALGGQIRQQTQSIPTGHTFRFHTRRCMAADLPLYIGVDFVLGHPCDRPISRWEEMFLPMEMRRYLDEVTVADVAGKSVPLVVSDKTLFTGTRPPVRTEPPRWGIYFLLAGVILASAMLLLHRGAPRSKAAHVILAILIFAWTLLGALASAALLFFDLVSSHWPTYYNENFFQMPPVVLLALAVLVLPVGRRKRKLLAILWGVTAASSLLGLGLKLLPAFYQNNWEFIFWLLPVHVAVAIIFWQRSRIVAGVAVKQEKP
jgi:hypothetical protein